MSSQWRYGIEGEDIIWYPPDSVRLYRQGRSEADLKMALYRIAKDWHRTLALREKVAA
jgi:hypothetical protein